MLLAKTATSLGLSFLRSAHVRRLVERVASKTQEGGSGMVFRLGVGLCIAVLLSGCAVYGVAAVSNAGKAYVIHSSWPYWNQDMLLCDASTGSPVCKVQAER